MNFAVEKEQKKGFATKPAASRKPSMVKLRVRDAENKRGLKPDRPAASAIRVELIRSHFVKLEYKDIRFPSKYVMVKRPCLTLVSNGSCFLVFSLFYFVGF